MKVAKAFIPVIVIAMAFLVHACGPGGGSSEKMLPKAGGKNSELIIVVDTTYWNALTGEALISTFAREQAGLPQPEPVFDIVNIPHRAFSNVFKHTKNILLINIKKGKKATFSRKENKWARPQMVVEITAPNDKAASEIIRKNGNKLVELFRDKQLERLKKRYEKQKDKGIASLLEKKHHFSLSVPSDFKVAVDTNKFTWLKRELNINGHHLSQSILVYHYDYKSDSTFTNSYLLNARDSVAKRYVPGPEKGSYMKTYREYSPVKREITLQDNYAMQLRGLWNTEGAFMGGPFVNYSFVDEKRGRVIGIDVFVFAPKFDKRNYLRELEAIAHTVKPVN